MTLWRLRFLESERLLPRDPQRAKALISYLTASLALSPLHFAGAVRVARGDRVRSFSPAAVGVHAVVLLLQFLLASQAEAHFLWQLVEMPKGQARLMGVVGAVTRLIDRAAWYCAALPAMFVFMGRRSR